MKDLLPMREPSSGQNTLPTGAVTLANESCNAVQCRMTGAAMARSALPSASEMPSTGFGLASGPPKGAIEHAGHVVGDQHHVGASSNGVGGLDAKGAVPRAAGAILPVSEPAGGALQARPTLTTSPEPVVGAGGENVIGT